MAARATYLIGQETCQRCGRVTMLITDNRQLPTEICQGCGGVAAVEVWFPSDVWPEVVGLVRFDVERQRLHLPRWTWPVRPQ